MADDVVLANNTEPETPAQHNHDLTFITSHNIAQPKLHHRKKRKHGRKPIGKPKRRTKLILESQAEKVAGVCSDHTVDSFSVTPTKTEVAPPTGDNQALGDFKAPDDTLYVELVDVHARADLSQTDVPESSAVSTPDDIPAPANALAQADIVTMDGTATFKTNAIINISHDISQPKVPIRKKRKHGRKSIGKPRRRTKRILELQAKNVTGVCLDDVPVQVDGPAPETPVQADVPASGDAPVQVDGPAPDETPVQADVPASGDAPAQVDVPASDDALAPHDIQGLENILVASADVPSQTDPPQVDASADAEVHTRADDMTKVEAKGLVNLNQHKVHQRNKRKRGHKPIGKPKRRTKRILELHAKGGAGLVCAYLDHTYAGGSLPLISTLADDAAPTFDPHLIADDAPPIDGVPIDEQKADDRLQTPTDIPAADDALPMNDLAPADEKSLADAPPIHAPDSTPTPAPAPAPDLNFHYDFQNLKDETAKHEEELNEMKFSISKTTDQLHLIQAYEHPSSLFVKLSVSIDFNFHVTIKVHGKVVHSTHAIFTTITQIQTVNDILRLAKIINEYHVCTGNPEKKYKEIFTGKGATYMEENCGAAYCSTIRANTCELLSLGTRCIECQKKRGCFRTRERRVSSSQHRLNGRSPEAILSSSRPNSSMTREELDTKNKLMKSKMKRLELQNRRLREKIQREISNHARTFKQSEEADIDHLVNKVTPQVEDTFTANSFQRIFWEEQVRYNKFKNKGSMRWHPLIVKWALLLKSKSSKAYQIMRESGFINLPSQRTLYNYSHCTPIKIGFVPEVLNMLTEQCKQKGIFSEDWKQYVGILQDEIKIKSDLVFCPTSGELIGYMNLDETSNQIKKLEDSITNTPSELATSALVLMVRGAASDLRFPLATFATHSLDAKQLYTVIWQAIDLLELEVGLKVLYITCDGAGQNRKFFELHRDGTHNPDEPVHSVTNPYDPDRQIYFISDAPHLIKTARNCFANSHSHKMSRHLWNNGYSISWLHIVKLYEEHIEKNLYTKSNLNRSHIDLTSYSQMKVNLACQIFSTHVAEHLAEEYGDEVSGTVEFLRLMNKFFDCVNTRSLYEGRNKRNANLDPYKDDSTDERLQWLSTTFLEYFEKWRNSVKNRPGNFTAKERAKMQISRQTTDGLKITVRSIVQCVKFLLKEGAPFVLTEKFNQDILEQHFGHYRHKGGANDNPTMNDVRHTITVLRVVGSTALAPLRGNTKRRKSNPASLETLSAPLARKKSRPSFSP